MLTSPNDVPNSLTFVEAQPGDEFYLVATSRFMASPVSVTAYKVIRAGKRDIVYTAIGSGLEKRITRTAVLYNAYLTQEEVAWARALIRLSKKQKQNAAWKIIQDNKIEAIPEELADQIIMWGSGVGGREGQNT